MLTKVIAFDIFNTVYDLSTTPKDEIRAYGSHISKEGWSRLFLPKSWQNLKAFPDAKAGIERLREKYLVVTCSNGPMALQTRLNKNNGISWDFLIPLEERKIFKPNPLAYQMIADIMGVKTEEVAMITANKTFGDIEGASALGMAAFWIRGESKIVDINALAGILGA
jgi:2-haloalkanoic acid dehalogenase type II